MKDRENAAVIVAHPGHELMVHHWMERHRPIYFCLTEGSGGSAGPRMESTSRLLQGVGATPGPIYGRYSDKEIYQLLLDGRVDAFVSLLNELADSLIASDVTCVAGDAIEGFNPVHDLCRALIDGAVGLIEIRTGRVLRNYEFALDHRPDAAPEALRTTVSIALDAAALERKLAAAMSYPEMQREVEWALKRFGAEAFATEYLRPSSLPTMVDEFANTRPRFETYGRLRVSEGRYREVIRYREHVLPVFAAVGVATLREQWTT